MTKQVLQNVLQEITEAAEYNNQIVGTSVKRLQNAIEVARATLANIITASQAQIERDEHERQIAEETDQP